jgi:hypothetical protein
MKLKTIMSGRRNIRGLMVDSKAWLRLSVPFFVLLLSNLAMVIVISRRMSASVETFLTADSPNPQTISAVTILASSVRDILMIGTSLSGFLSVALWILYSHRILGPVVPIRRHIGRLFAKDFESRIHLRKNDELKDIAEDLNRLSEFLKKEKAARE